MLSTGQTDILTCGVVKVTPKKESERRKHKAYREHPQFPWIGVHASPVYPSYLIIGGSGIVGNFGAESPMSEKDETPQQEAAEGASMNSGSGAAAGAAPTYGGSGVA